MHKSTLLFSLTYFLLMTIVVFSFEEITNEYHNTAKKLFDTAFEMEIANPEAAIAIYNKIIKDYPKAYDLKSVVDFEFADESKQRIEVINCRQAGVERMKITDFESFFRTFQECVKAHDIDLLEQITTCEFSVGYYPLTDGLVTTNIKIFGQSIFSKIPANLVNVKLQKTDELFSDYTFSAIRINELHSTLFMGRDRSRAAFFIQNNVNDPESDIQIYLFEKDEYWYLTTYYPTDN